MAAGLLLSLLNLGKYVLIQHQIFDNKPCPCNKSNYLQGHQMHCKIAINVNHGFFFG